MVEQVRIEVISSDLHAPMSLAFLPNGDLLIAKKEDGVHLLRRRNGIQFNHQVERVEVLPVGAFKPHAPRMAGETDRYDFKGLHDIALDPDFGREGNRTIFAAFDVVDQGKGGPSLTLARGELSPDGKSLANFRRIYTTDGRVNPDGPTGGLPGGRLAFLPDKTLLMSVGDWRRHPTDEKEDLSKADPQLLTSDLGKILRLSRNGSIPADNPYSGKGAKAASFSIGHRDVQGLVVVKDPKGTVRVWATEHGPQGGDELNEIFAGRNYGYPLTTFGLRYGSNDQIPGSSTTPRMKGEVLPKFIWGRFETFPGDGTPGTNRILPGYSIAPSGLVVYWGNAYRRWAGNIFVGAMNRSGLRSSPADDGLGGIWRLRECNGVIEPRQIIDIQRPDGRDRIRDLRVGPDGLIYAIRTKFKDASPNGEIIRLVPVP
jgi:glucose/arabinose dehydrogenase